MKPQAVPNYSDDRKTARASLVATLRNEERPPIWEQVSDWFDRNGPLSNSEHCGIAGVDTLKASKMLKRWVEQGVLVKDDSGGKRNTFYTKNVPGLTQEDWAGSLSIDLDNNAGQ